jgi:hypothetical protein
MGGASAGQGIVLNPYIWDDPAYILVNPAHQAMYKDYLWTNIGGGTLAGITTVDNGYGLQNAGVNFALDNQWAVGTVLSFDPSFVNTTSGLLRGAGVIGVGLPALSIMQRAPQVIPPVANVWEALISYDGSSVDLGFGFMYGSSNADSSLAAGAVSSNNEASARVLGFRAGALLDLGSGNAVDVGVALRLDKATDKITRTPAPTTANDGDYSASGTEIQIQGRAKFKLSSRVNLVPFVAFATLSGEPTEDAKPTSVAAATPRTLKASLTAFSVGVGTEYRTTDIFLASGISFFSARAKVEASSAAVGAAPASSLTGTVSNTALPVFNLGGEWWFLDWLAGRAGYYRAAGSAKLKIESTTGAISASSETNFSTPSSFLLFGNVVGDGIVTLGLGLRFGDVSLDATVSEEALRRGFGVFGSSDNLNAFGYMNASFNFQ